MIEKLGMTKAPWKWVDKSDCSILMAKDSDDSCDMILDDGSAWGEYGQSIDPQSPNAQLIAAAPEMLESLIEDLIEDEAFYKTRGYKSVEEIKDIPRGGNGEYKSFTRKKLAVQKATNKSWEEIKELIE